MANDVILLERANTEELLAYLTSPDDAIRPSGEAVLSKLVTVLSRKLGRISTPVPSGSDNIDRLERFFDTIMDVEPLPPVPYTAAELTEFAREATALLLKESSECHTGGETSMAEMYDDDARDYDTIANNFAAGHIKMGEEVRSCLDTAARHWLFAAGADEERYFATIADIDRRAGIG